MKDSQLIKQFLEAVRDEIIIEQQALDLQASGKSARSLRIVGYQLIGDESFIYQENKVGRRPGAMPPVDSIKKWLEARGMSDYNPWAVAKSIAKKGTEIFRREKQGIETPKIIANCKAEFLQNIAREVTVELIQSIRKK